MSDRFMKTRDAARGRWKQVLIHFGVDEAFLTGKACACPLCGGKDRFRFDDLDGDGTYFCNGCDPGSGLGLLMKLKHWEFERACKEVDAILGNLPAPPDAKRREVDTRAVMRSWWAASRAVQAGDPVWRYLERRCGPGPFPVQDLRFHPGLKHPSGGVHPAMLAGMGWDGKRFGGVHRTYLTMDGRKAALDPVRMSFGEIGPVRLGTPGTTLGIAEGIETALCASRRFRVPVWSAICADGLSKWTPPPGVAQVMIFGDNDASFAGQAAAYALARRLVRDGMGATVLIPEAQGTDWADVQIREVA
jgi:putative DNA primase/helicase